MDIEDNNQLSRSLSGKGLSARVGFIRKVYSILTFQMLLTVFMCVLSMSSKSFFAFQINNIWTFYFSWIVAIVLMIMIRCSPHLARTVPTNYYILFGFTFAESYMVSMICGLYDQNIVLMAAVMTCGIFFALTLYACTTTTDFTMCGGFLFMFSVTMLISGLFLMFTNNDTAHIIYSMFGVIMFGIYILYDTQLIIGDKSLKFEIDDYILATIEIYIDIIGLFLHLLEILGRTSNKN